MSEPWILLAEPSRDLADEYRAALSRSGYPVRHVLAHDSIYDAMISGDPPALIVLDLGAAGKADGLDLLAELNTLGPVPPVIAMTGSASVNTAVRAMQSGARDFLVKPFNPARLREAVEKALTENPHTTMPAALAGALTPQPVMPPAQTATAKPFHGFIGTSPVMLRIYEQIEHAARSQATVFITGESGTGKDVCAEAIHNLSARRDKPFIPLNCAAIPRDLMESELFGHVKGAFTGAISDRDGAATLANGGTLFFDEIAEMTPDMQTKLLRFLQNFTYMKVGGSRLDKTDVRIVCATNREPMAEIRAGRFREDLFYRLHVLPIHMPGLRDRGDDVLDLALGLLRRYAEEEDKDFPGFAPDAEQALHQYAWPGNIRQLQNVIRHVVVMHEPGPVTARMLPATLLHQQEATGAVMDGAETRAPTPLYPNRPVIRPLADVERETIEQAIDLYGGNIAHAAAALGISPSTIYRKKAGWDERPAAQDGGLPSLAAANRP